ncbi:MAG: crossover junction endodeoxyribonuclease RuvC [Deltaproteobacteria bacterium]|nr:crossover junction endodeoxyribonuclease RuvC [Deltaproteobacteria bacterium]
MRILGIDPGSTATGFGVVERVEGRVIHVAHGTLRPPRGLCLARRLSFLHASVSEQIRQHGPEVAVVERVFIAANPRSALVLGQARGAILAALAAEGLEVGELAAREVKKAVTGTGAATKAQVQSMVARLLDLDAEPPSDAADALAVAICRAHMGRLAGMDLRGASRRRRRPRSVSSLRGAR